MPIFKDFVGVLNVFMWPQGGSKISEVKNRLVVKESKFLGDIDDLLMTCRPGAWRGSWRGDTPRDPGWPSAAPVTHPGFWKMSNKKRVLGHVISIDQLEASIRSRDLYWPMRGEY